MGKVRFGLSNVRYAVLDTTKDTYGTPVKMTGAVTLEVSYDGETSTFRADNKDYASFNGTPTISGTLTIADVPADFCKDVLKYVEDNGVLFEDLGAQSAHVALLFEISGNEADQRFCLYDVTFSRPGMSANTTDTTITPDTLSLSFTAVGKDLTIGGVTVNTAKSSVESSDAAYDTFMDKVYLPAA